MFTTEVREDAATDPSPEAIRDQLETMVKDPVFRSSKRSVQFLTYVVEQTLHGAADQIKERTIGVEVFGRDPSYDTNLDHVVRTAAIELRKRLAIYYGEERHRGELRMSLVPGSYIPRFTHASAAPLFARDPATLPLPPTPLPDEPVPHLDRSPHSAPRLGWYALAALALLALTIAGFRWMHPASAQDLFWKPVLDTPGSVLLAVGDVPNGPPTAPPSSSDQDQPLPSIHKASASTVPFADTVTIARVLGILQAHGKTVTIRPESASSFSDLREGAAVLVGAFNNEWSLRLTRKLRYTLALDPDRHLIYISDSRNRSARTWSWETDGSSLHQGEAGGPPLHDYALISRIWNSETGHVVVVIGGLYTYGTQTAGEFLADPQMMQTILKAAPLDIRHGNLQIVLGTTVTDGTPGPPTVLAVSNE